MNNGFLVWSSVKVSFGMRKLELSRTIKANWKWFSHCFNVFSFNWRCVKQWHEPSRWFLEKHACCNISDSCWQASGSRCGWRWRSGRGSSSCSCSFSSWRQFYSQWLDFIFTARGYSQFGWLWACWTWQRINWLRNLRFQRNTFLSSWLRSFGNLVADVNVSHHNPLVSYRVRT